MNKIFALVFCTIALALVGCQNTVNQYHQDKRFVTDDFLRDRLVLVSMNTSSTVDGFMRVQLEVKNDRVGWFSQLWSSMTKEVPYGIQYKFDWFDKNGMAKNSEALTSWQYIKIIPGESKYLQSVAPDTSCVDFKISLKEAN